eukprot:TRINITY_DN7866_c0_g2_i14.p1 TRINITY_DN7866_c0_g2~~TRINITY_DN7866_c0_g2_i14.p1  ORF type:complete len:127 (+),score=10.37 TRINITY_DN7866_c0_g2_i14:341-721(+)
MFIVMVIQRDMFAHFFLCVLKGDCHNPSGEKNMCAVGAINNFTAQLETYGDSSSDKYNLTESLMFLAHIVGDIHQPLHAGFLADLGGNRLRVQWYQELTNCRDPGPGAPGPRRGRCGRRTNRPFVK